MKFTEQFTTIADMIASHAYGLERVRNHRKGTLKYFDPNTGAFYSMHENGYFRRWVIGWSWRHNARMTCYQLNPTRKVVETRGERTYKSTERIMMTDMYDMLLRTLKAVEKYRVNNQLA